MKILALDTSTEACSAALLIGTEVTERYELAASAHSQLILPMIESLCADAGVRLQDLDALAFGRGPGSFTGVRIAAGVAQGLAFGADLPVVPVSTLAAVAQGAYAAHQQPRVLVALDARMGEAYWGAFVRNAQGVMQAAQDECVAAPSQIPDPPAGTWFGAGIGWTVYADALRERFAAVPIEYDGTLFPRARHMLDIAVLEFTRGTAVAAELALPVYLRDKVTHTRS